MRPYDISATARAGFLALMVVVVGCGRKDSGTTVDTGSRTETSTAVRVTDVGLGRELGADKRLANEIDDFRPNDVIYAVVKTEGSGPSTQLQARWTYEDGQVVDESSQSIAASGEDFTEFHISKPSGLPKGKYKVQILLNGQPAESEDFEVK
ncbi:MAG TPA: hypothetical protein VJ808_14035 [Gemmatimonadales bacterium]|nr:hypothetical protein [Gemmatimonadales bacterium]